VCARVLVICKPSVNQFTVHGISSLCVCARVPVIIYKPSVNQFTVRGISSLCVSCARVLVVYKPSVNLSQYSSKLRVVQHEGRLPGEERHMMRMEDE